MNNKKVELKKVVEKMNLKNLTPDVDVSENYSIYEDEYSAYINVYGTNDTVSLTASMSLSVMTTAV